MKKVFVVVAVIATIGSAFAANSFDNEVAETVKCSVEAVGDTVVNDTVASVSVVETVVEENAALPEVVAKSVADNYPEATVKSFQSEEKEDYKLYTIVISDKNGAESTVLVKENGELVK
ncbi:MAG: hypothetical protein NC206_02155 [Bacteroides sp.]|nr:hypothetical protein [Roseburia sp.]MCM1345870.1 hypothetical protein [Bacteroides sp.]MCM1421702.1 hypothetical protein [Bacteroides sp.]